MARLRATDVFTGGFWVNYFISLAATIWIPVAHLTFVNETTGEVISDSMLPMYKIYLDLLQDPTLATAYKYVAFHLGVVFAVTFGVWYIVLRRSSRPEPQGEVPTP